MKNLRFHELLLLSRSERRARRVKFHPKANVIRGPNGTGKSSLLKSLYWTLGAEPSHIHPRWREANVAASLRISIDDLFIRVIRFGNRYCIFDHADTFIAAFPGVTSGLSSYFANLFDFHLLLPTRGGDAQATPAFLFLPFYLDQDNGWTSPHESFAQLGQFVAPRKDTLEFHTGIRPSEYYEAKSRQTKAEIGLQPLRAQRSALQGVLSTIDARLATLSFDLDLSIYQAEIRRLLERCNALRDVEDSRKRSMVDAFAYKRAVEEQQTAVQDALQELRADREYAARIADPVICPTCHALYSNGFAERFEIALDEDTCITLLSELKDQEHDAANRWEQARESVSDARETIAEIEQILSIKRGEIALADVLRKEGQKDVSRELQNQIAELDQKIGRLDGDKTAASSDMKQFEDRKRRQVILEFYRAEMSRLLMRLDVSNLTEASYKDLHCTIKESGSHLPRAILAYFYSLLHTIGNYSTSTFCPVVIDSPHQQDQDADNWARILDCIRAEQPGDAQLILATSSDTGFDFGGNILDLSVKDQLLLDDDFEPVSRELLPLIDVGLR